jgi:IMP cyclohydrolase
VTQIEVGRTEQNPSVTRFHVRVTDDDGSATEHDVTSTSADLERLASGYPSRDAFIHACFQFLLERERKESILRRFDINQIATYFPEFDGEIGR